jgi:hypothetical protein
MADPVADSEEFVGSHMKAKNGYGQNGFQGASSDLPNEHTTSGFLPQAEIPTDSWQTRSVAKEAYPTTFGMKSPAEPAKIPLSNVRRATLSINSKSFQR